MKKRTKRERAKVKAKKRKAQRDQKTRKRRVNVNQQGTTILMLAVVRHGPQKKIAMLMRAAVAGKPRSDDDNSTFVSGFSRVMTM